MSARRLMMTVLTAVALTVVPGGMGRAQYAEVAIDTLTLPRAVELAYAYHPSVRGTHAGINLASGAYRQAFAGYLPTLGFTASDTHNEGVFVFTPTSGIREQIYSTYAATFSLQQTIFDFGRTISRVSAGDDLVEAATMDDTAGHNTLTMNVELAYFAVMQAREVVTVDEEAVQAATRHLAQANGFYSVGRRPQLDVKKAEVDLANANVSLISARNALRIARVQLDNAMGVHLPASAVISDSLPHTASIPTLDSLRAEAVARRPELLASRARLAASSSLITAAWTQHLPILSATGTYTWSNFAPDPLYPRWIAAVTLSVPIFQGYAVNAQVQQAQANEEIARAVYDQLTQAAMLEVEQNVLQWQEARERLVATAKLVEQAEEALVLAERQYAAGVGTPLDVTDAQLSRSNARITDIRARFDLSSALVRLQRSVGAIR